MIKLNSKKWRNPLLVKNIFYRIGNWFKWLYFLPRRNRFLWRRSFCRDAWDMFDVVHTRNLFGTFGVDPWEQRGCRLSRGNRGTEKLGEQFLISLFVTIQNKDKTFNFFLTYLVVNKFFKILKYFFWILFKIRSDEIKSDLFSIPFYQLESEVGLLKNLA